jgi:hypothetical protein
MVEMVDPVVAGVEERHLLLLEQLTLAAVEAAVDLQAPLILRQVLVVAEL